MKTNILLSTNPQKVLSLFLKHPYTDFVEGEVQRCVKISRSGTNYALRDLVKAGYIARKIRGKTYFYSLRKDHPVIKQHKVLDTVSFLMPLINKLKEYTDTIILYGSSARGEDHEDSDIDIFFVSHSKREIANLIAKFNSKRKIQFIVKTTLNYDNMKHTDPHFYNEINSGIILWEASHE